MKKLLFSLLLSALITFGGFSQEIPEKEWKYHDDPESIGWKTDELRAYIRDNKL